MNIPEISKNFAKELSKTKNIETVEQLRIKYLGRNGIIRKLLKDFEKLPLKKRKKTGIEINNLKNLFERELSNAENQVLKKQEKVQAVDVTLPGGKYPKGSFHPTSIAIEEISRIFEEIGFIRMSYPEVEWEYYSFDSLNMPPGHPARDDFETFFIDYPVHPKLGRMLLTPHTSSGQYREMKRVGKPPIRMINIAKCYRPNWDVTHVPMFYQFEGMVVDEGINITHLKGTIDYFAKQFFGEKRETRLRPFHFQFTEPSFEVDVTCEVCLGKGEINGQKCRVCKSGWLELGGAGMIHPNVLKEGGVDPEIYTGWAFGFGVERVFMMKEGLKLDDLRTVYEGDIRFLEQF